MKIKTEDKTYPVLELKKNSAGYSVTCPKGLWSVSGADKKTVVSEALRYFFLYAVGGEYK